MGVPELVSVAEYATQRGVNASAVYKWIKKGMPCWILEGRIVHGRRINPKECEKWHAAEKKSKQYVRYDPFEVGE